LRLAIIALVLAAAGCGDLILGISGGYTGPQPARESLTNEVAVVRQVRAQHEGQIALILDRVRYLEANDSHDVNRVVKAWTTRENQDAVAALNLTVGNRVVVSTEFSSIDETGGSLGVPNWPGHKAMEYPIGSHRIVQLARATP
jgi:hypothetical protein